MGGFNCAKKLKGSKKLRLILEPVRPEAISKNILTITLTITETVPSIDISKELNTIWGLNFLENSTRVFAFKLFNNVLGTNNRVSKFVRNHSPFCTFCEILGREELERESINHLFQDCPSVEPLITSIIRWFWHGTNNTVSRKDYLCGKSDEDTSKTRIWNIFVLTIKYYIWTCKLRHRVPVLEQLKITVIDKFRTYCSISNCLKYRIINTNGLAEEIIALNF
jgi:hypothetical protein